ncbi:MAG: hypothetical protein HRT81_04920 [Henriciella sp.]|nr:hypothetical protein [Henriciella sp.]
MKQVALAIGFAFLGTSACMHTSSDAEIIVSPRDDAMEQFAIGQVYDAHPTRALVDKVERVPSASEHTVLRIEMTGSPTARKIYELTISETDDGAFQLESLDILQ